MELLHKLVVVGLLLFIIYKYYFKKYDSFGANIWPYQKILSKSELTDLLLENSDNYYDRFNNIDLQVRNVSNIEEYKEKIRNSPVNINDYLKNIIIDTTKKIDEKFKNYKIIGFDGGKANTIKWSIGIIDGLDYEAGHPHTRDNIIIISKNLISSNNLLRVLLHEKVHVYQKIFKEDIKLYLKSNNFSISNYNNKSRANPDTDGFTYINQDNNQMLCLYNNNPKGIMDVTYYPNNLPMYEHPLEFMAYTVENMLV
jgi:hypothetical protein